MRNGAPFSKPRVRLYGKTGDAQQYLGAAYNLLFKVRQFCEASGVPVFAMQHTLENGAVVQAAILGDEEIVSCFPPTYVSEGGAPRRKRLVRKPLANFYAVPSSQAHTSGYVPQHPGHPDNTYPGPVSVWEEYNTYNVPPDAAPKASDSENAELHPAYKFEDRPGSHTWFSEQIVENDLPVVVSWRAKGFRYGRFSGGSHLQAWNAQARFGQAENPFVFPNSAFAADIGPSGSDLWINGRRYETNVPVRSAGLKREVVGGVDVLAVYVFSHRALFRGEVGGKTLNALTEKSYIELVQVGALTADVETMIQPPYFNASCTKAVFVADFTLVWPNAVTKLVEVSVPGCVQIEVLQGSTQTTQSAYGSVRPHPSVDVVETDGVGLEGSNITTESQSSSTTGDSVVVVTTTPLAGDYVGDDLTHIFGRVTKTNTLPAYGASFTIVDSIEIKERTLVPGTTNGSSNHYTYQVSREFDFTSTDDRATKPAQFDMVTEVQHSKLGLLHVSTQSREYLSSSRAGSGSQSVSGETVMNENDSGTIRFFVSSTVPELVRTVTADVRTEASLEFVSELNMRNSPLLLGGDIRFGSFLVGHFTQRIAPGRSLVSRETGRLALRFSDDSARWYEVRDFPPGDTTGAWDDVAEGVAGFSLFVLGKKVGGVSDFAAFPKQVLPDSVSGSSTPRVTRSWDMSLDAAGVFTNPGSSSTTTARTELSYPVVIAVSDFERLHDAIEATGSELFISPDSCKFAFSPDGKHGYISVHIKDNAGAAPFRWEKFVIDGTTFDVPEDYYAPGENSTLAGAVFFGATQGENEEIDEL